MCSVGCCISILSKAVLFLSRSCCSCHNVTYAAAAGLTFLAPWQSRIERRPEADRLLNATCHLLQEFEISTLLSITYSIHSIKCFCNTPCFATVGCFTAALWLDFHNFVRKYQVRCDLPGTARVAKRGGHAPSCGAPQLTLDSTCQVQLAQNLPFMIDRSLIADNVSYEADGQSTLRA